MSEKTHYWTVGRYINNEETFEEAKARAEREAINEGGKVYLYKLVGVVSVVEKTVVTKSPEWANVAPASEPENFEINEIVEADWANRNESSFTTPDWRRAWILKVQEGATNPYRVKFECDKTDYYAMKSRELRKIK